MVNSFKLKKGDCIGIFSPSTPITAKTPNRFKRSIEYLESKGFKIIKGNLTEKTDFYRSGSIKERAEELNDLIRNPDIKCIMSTIGGMNSNSLLSHIDYESFKNNPKPIIGYSDVTAILLGIYAKTGISTYYGPALVASFGELNPFVDITYKYFEDILINEINLPHKIKNPDFWTEEFIDWETQDRGKYGIANELVTVYDGKVQGRLIGGNLNTMTCIWNTQYMPEIKQGTFFLLRTL